MDDTLWDALDIGQSERCNEWHFFLNEWIDWMVVDETTPREEILSLWDEYLDTTEPPPDDYDF